VPITFGIISPKISISSVTMAEPLTAEHLCRLHAYAGGTDGVGDGVEREDSRQRTTRVVFVLRHQLRRTVALFLTQVDITERRGHQHRFQHGA